MIDTVKIKASGPTQPDGDPQALEHQGRLGGCGRVLTHPRYGMEGVWQHVVAGLIASPGVMKFLLDQEGVPLFQIKEKKYVWPPENLKLCGPTEVLSSPG